MRINVLNPLATYGLVVALSVLGLACGSDKTTETGGSGGDTDTDTDSDSDSDTDIPVTTGFARVVNLLVDHTDGVNIHLNDDPTPLNSEAFLTGSNTDATGLDYVPFPPSDYKVDFRDFTTDASALIIDPVVVVLGEYQTIVAIGSEFAGANIDALYGVDSFLVFDDLTTPGAGNHRVQLYLAAPGTPAVGAWMGADAMTATGVPDTVAYGDGAGVTWTVTSGAQTLYLDVTQDGIADQSYDITLADDAWSYIYLLPDPNQVLPTGTALHHVRGVDNNPIPPN